MSEILYVSPVCDLCGYVSGSPEAITSGCINDPSVIQLFGEIYQKIPYAGERGECCPVCDVEMGGYHHCFCPHEVCPCCDEYLLGCDCTSDPDE